MIGFSNKTANKSLWMKIFFFLAKEIDKDSIIIKMLYRSNCLEISKRGSRLLKFVKWNLKSKTE